MLVAAFVLLLAINALQAWTRATAGPMSAATTIAPRRVSDATTEPAWVRRALIAVALAFLTVFLFVPLVAVFVEALRKGVDVYLAAIVEPDALSAIRLTLVAAAIAVPLNLVFGVAAAWAIAKFDFRGKSLLLTLIDLPFSVSPVIAGLIFVLLFGAARLARRMAARPRPQDHLRPARHRASRRCSSPSRSSPAS